MAGKHRSGKRSTATTAVRHGSRHASSAHEPYKWLGAGAVTLGVGVALATGSGFAHADTTSSSSSGTSADTSSASSGAGESSDTSSIPSSTGDSAHSPSGTTSDVVTAPAGPSDAVTTPPGPKSSVPDQTTAPTDPIGSTASEMSGGGRAPSNVATTPTQSAPTSDPTSPIGSHGAGQPTTSTAGARGLNHGSSGQPKSRQLYSAPSAAEAVVGAKAQMANATVHVASAPARAANTPAATTLSAPTRAAGTSSPMLTGLASVLGVNQLGVDPLGPPVPVAPSPMTEMLWAAFRTGGSATSRQSSAMSSSAAAPMSAAAASSQEPDYGTFKTISLGGTPTNVTISSNGGRAWAVVNGEVELIDISNSTPTVAAVIPVGSNPTLIAASADGKRAYVTNTGDGTVSIIETGTTGKPTVTTVAVGSNPTGIAVNSNGTRAFVANTGSGTVTIIDYAPLPFGLPSTPKVTTVSVGPGPTSVATNSAGTVAYVTNSSGNTVSIIKDNGYGTPTVTSAQVSASPTSVKTSDTGSTAIVYSQGGVVSIINASGATPQVTQVPGTHISYVDDPGFIAMSADGTTAFVTEHDANRVAIINTATPGNEPTYANFNDFPHSIVAYRTGALAFTVAHDALYVIDAKTGTAAPIQVPADNDSSQYQRVAISSTGNRVIAVDNSGNLTVFYYTSSDGSSGPDGGQSLNTLIDTFLNPKNGVFVQITGLGQTALEVIGHAGPATALARLAGPALGAFGLVTSVIDYSEGVKEQEEGRGLSGGLRTAAGTLGIATFGGTVLAGAVGIAAGVGVSAGIAAAAPVLVPVVVATAAVAGTAWLIHTYTPW